MKKRICLLIVLMLFMQLTGCKQEIKEEINNYSDVYLIQLDGNKATINNSEIKEYDYIWHISPELEDDYYEGEEPKGDIYIAHDIIYYPSLPEDQFVKEDYDGEMEWCFHYTCDELKEYIFSTLPVLGNDLPIEMMHSEEEAYNNPVLHICAAGEYILSGNWNGQIWIDLGEDSFSDEEAKVKLILNGVNVNCTVAPGIVFKNVYECDNAWEESDVHSNIVDLSNAGAKVVVVDGTENNVSGYNVFRLLKANYKKDGSTVQKKRFKMDGAFYSYQSLLIQGEEKGTGILNITSCSYEGLNSELHLTIDSSYINIISNDDGINVNEDDVSVFTMNGGHLTIFAGQGAEGDVVDSNGYIVVNGGTILGTSLSFSDNLFDSNNGTTISDNAKVISSVAGKEIEEGMPRGFDFKNQDGFEERPRGDFKPNENPPGDFDPMNNPFAKPEDKK